MTEKLQDPPALTASTRRWQRSGVAVFLLLVLAFPIFRLTEGTRLDDALASEKRAQIGAGRQLWSLNCAMCHGTQGEGSDSPALNSQEFLKSPGLDELHRAAGPRQRDRRREPVRPSTHDHGVERVAPGHGRRYRRQPRATTSRFGIAFSASMNGFCTTVALRTPSPATSTSSSLPSRVWPAVTMA